jgi:AcrR family transcriptional regulator
LDATAAVIAERGTTNVSFAEIAKAAGCSHGLPGYLFGSKTDLLLALIHDVLARFRNELVAPAVGSSHGLDAVVSIMRVFLQTLDRPLPYTRAIYVMIGEGMGAAPELRAALNVHHDAVRVLLRDTLADGIERGDIRADVNPDALAVALFGMARGIGSQVLLDPKAVDVRAVTNEVLDSMRRSLVAEGADG